MRVLVVFELFVLISLGLNSPILDIFSQTDWRVLLWKNVKFRFGLKQTTSLIILERNLKNY